MRGIAPKGERFGLLLSIAAFTMAIVLPSGSLHGWIIEVVDSPKQFSDMTTRSLAVDIAGHPHIAYGQDHLYYAWNDGIVWHMEKVDESPSTGTYAAIALDPYGRPHISYCSWVASGAELRHAYKDDSGWRYEVVDGGGATGLHTSIAIGSDGSTWIAFQDRTPWGFESALKCAFKISSGWHIELVDIGPNTGKHAALCLDQTDRPSVAYCYDDSVKFASRPDVGSWTHETIEYVDDWGGYTSLAMDSIGTPHISYYWYSSYRKYLKYATRDAAGWLIEQVDGGTDPGWAGMHSSIAVGENGMPVISYQQYSRWQLKFAWRDESGWHLNMVDDGGAGGPRSRLLHISSC